MGLACHNILVLFSTMRMKVIFKKNLLPCKLNLLFHLIDQQALLLYIILTIPNY